MREIKVPRWRYVLLSFATIFGVNLGLSAIRQLHAIGHPISRLLLDSAGIAAVCAILIDVVERKSAPLVKGNH